MRYSRYYIPTLREEPSEAQIISHKLMLRAGLIRKLASGIYNWLPLGFRVFRKVENIIREEMERAGAVEFRLSILQPSFLWEESGRWDIMGKEMFRLEDRHNNFYSLGPTHEEAFTYLLALDIKSYRELPINVFQIHTKFRDEIRPRYGVMRAREFVMKDAYSFDIDEEGLENSYQAMREAYRRIFRRCGLSVVPVEADVGTMGGYKSEEFMVPSVIGEEIIVKCDNCGYVANQERAEFFVEDVQDKSKTYPNIEEIETKDVRTIDELVNFIGEPSSKFIKTLIYVVDGKPVMVLIRGDKDVNEVKLKNVLSANEVYLPDKEYIEKEIGLPVGFLGPIGVSGMKILVDKTILSIDVGYTGANKKDYHLKNVVPYRDLDLSNIVDVASASEGDLCPVCKSPMKIFRGIEVGHVFKLGDKYTKAFDFTVLDKDGKAVYPLMGCYGIGVDRTVATIVEQNNDDYGIVWPLEVAPFLAIITTIGRDEKVFKASYELYEKMKSANIEVLWDDRDENAGVKFNDADLIGIPYRIVVSKKLISKGQWEIKERKTGKVFYKDTSSLIEFFINILK
jgi:prolyl-tRNA synthetase